MEVVDLPTAGDALAAAGALAVLGALVVALGTLGALGVDVDLAVLGAEAPGLLATRGAAVEMLLICIIACL
ncbi:MAG: hypothetical protein ABSC32_18640 [Steroidobacteraceae bacterium]